MTTRQLGTGGLRRRVQEFSARALRSVVLRVQKPSDSYTDPSSESDFVFYRRHRLPPKRMRAMMCGDAFQNEQFYFMSAVLEATKFTELLSAKDALVVDIGSGLGRLATGAHRGVQRCSVHRHRRQPGVTTLKLADCGAT